MRTVEGGLIADAASLWPALRGAPKEIADVVDAEVSRLAGRWCAKRYFAASMVGTEFDQSLIERFCEHAVGARNDSIDTSIIVTMKPHPFDDERVLVEITTTLANVREALIEALGLRPYGWREVGEFRDEVWLSRGQAWLAADASRYPSATSDLSGFFIDYEVACAEVLRYGGKRLALTDIKQAEDVLFATAPTTSQERRELYEQVKTRVLAERAEAVRRGETVNLRRPLEHEAFAEAFGAWDEASH